MKKLYNIRETKFGIDFDSILCFYIDGEIDTYKGKCKKDLIINIGTKFGKPSEIKLLYSEYKLIISEQEPHHFFKEQVNENVNSLYQDLIEYFKEN